ncbi:MAG: SUMF1/EgtB/PvdO family nonheme iron enzyme [Bryobacteraceae bacterium]
MVKIKLDRAVEDPGSIGSLARSAGRGNGNRMHPVAAKRPNGFGLYDMLGSESEWVND